MGIVVQVSMNKIALWLMPVIEQLNNDFYLKEFTSNETQMKVNSFTKPIEMNIFDIFIVTK